MKHTNKVRRVTGRAHDELEKVIQSGDRVVDATVGNGHDTRFLAERVGGSGRVAGFDIQYQALKTASLRLEQAGCRGWVDLHEAGHEQMERVLGDWRGMVRAVVFNLGYLPGGDHSVTTMARSTLPALDQARELLCPGGLLSVMLYHGHPGGQEEMEAVLKWADGLNREIDTSQLIEIKNNRAPKLLLIRKDIKG